MSEIFISTIFLILLQLYMVAKILRVKIQFLNFKTIFVSTLLVLIIGYLYSFSASILRVIVVVAILSIGNYFIFKKELGKTVLATFFTNIMFAVSEIIFVMLMMIFQNFTLETLKNDFFGNIITNACICSITIIMFNIPIIKKKLIDIMDFKFKNSSFWLVTFSFLGILISSVSIYIVYYKL